MQHSTSPWRGLAALALALPALAASAFGPANPLDALVRGKWVRFWDTGKGHDTATLCIPAEDAAGVSAHRGELPGRIRALHEAGARAVVIDLDLSQADPSDGALAAAIAAGPTVVPAGDSAPSFDTDAPAASRAQTRTPYGGLVLGVPASPDSGPPLAIAGLALSRGETPPETLQGRAIVADRIVAADGDLLPFMPYEIPFIHWEDAATWATAAGRIVFVGACRADRHLTRFGRQPGTVAHGELVETVLAGQRPRQAPPLVDLLLAMTTFGLGSAAGARLGPSAAGGIGVLGLLVSLGISLAGVWAGLTPVALAGLGALLWTWRYRVDR